MYLSFPARKSKLTCDNEKTGFKSDCFPEAGFPEHAAGTQDLPSQCCVTGTVWPSTAAFPYKNAHLFVLKLNVYKTTKPLSQWTWTWCHMAVFPAFRRWGQEDQESLGSLDCTEPRLAFLYLKQARVSGQRNINWESVSIRQLVAESLGCFLF